MLVLSNDKERDTQLLNALWETLSTSLNRRHELYVAKLIAKLGHLNRSPVLRVARVGPPHPWCCAPRFADVVVVYEARDDELWLGVTNNDVNLRFTVRLVCPDAHEQLRSSIVKCMRLHSLCRGGTVGPTGEHRRS